MTVSNSKQNSLALNQRVVFLHIAKTAGTSIVHFFRQRLPAQSVCSHGDFLSLPPERDIRQQELRQFQFISGHFGYSDVDSLLEKSYSFTFLRDPVERVLSFYKFCLHPDMQRRFPVARAAQRLGLEGFIESRLPEVCEMLDSQQTWQLAHCYWEADRRALSHLPEDDLLQLAEQHLRQFNRVGLTGSFDRDFTRILTDLGIDEPVPARRQLRTPQPLSQDQLSPRSLGIIQERQQLDYALLGRARRLLQEQCGGSRDA